jgi:hypothetical protein
MESTDQSISQPLNTQSILSLVFGVLTILAFCMGVAPIPFTGFVCFPASLLLGILAILFGVVSLNTIPKQNESGRPMAWIGIAIGGLVFLCVLFAVFVIVFFLVFAPGSIHTPPFIQNYQI